MTIRLRRIMELAGYAVTVVLVCVAALAILEYATGTQPFYVVTDNPSSMSPTINYGGLAVIYRAPFSGLRPGTIIAFHDPRGNPGIILHRIVAVESCGGGICLTTKGDNNATNPVTDPWNVTQSDYVGEAILLVPYLGYVSPALWGFSGFSTLLPLSVVVIAVALVSVLRQPPQPATKKEAS